ncbi:MAG: hypothetical protein CO189_01900 [candidate division Zixibacteria bacterium CG_4_9_14_3_um_filter_46_8]|nr:MAG: hypothetical protein CO189_01900 [candidate division Zixibacteria bacterium CG_4_9_14_3_um_filter_46_8]
MLFLTPGCPRLNRDPRPGVSILIKKQSFLGILIDNWVSNDYIIFIYIQDNAKSNTACGCDGSFELYFSNDSVGQDPHGLYSDLIC